MLRQFLIRKLIYEQDWIIVFHKISDMAIHFLYSIYVINAQFWIITCNDWVAHHMISRIPNPKLVLNQFPKLEINRIQIQCWINYFDHECLIHNPHIYHEKQIFFLENPNNQCIIFFFLAAPECDAGQFSCNTYKFNTTNCISSHFRCDKEPDCNDKSDESNCSKYQYHTIFLIRRTEKPISSH